MTTRRHFWRCPDCLSVLAVDGENSSLTCAICDTAMEHMGYVRRHRLVTHTDHLCPCDHRCTGAAGPDCSCQCGGENHGSGVVVAVDRTTSIPRVTPIDVDKARQRAAEWRAALESTRNSQAGQRIAAIRARMRDERVEYSAFMAQLIWGREMTRIKGLRTHAARIKALAKLQATIFTRAEVAAA